MGGGIERRKKKSIDYLRVWYAEGPRKTVYAAEDKLEGG